MVFETLEDHGFFMLEKILLQYIDFSCFRIKTLEKVEERVLIRLVRGLNLFKIFDMV